MKTRIALGVLVTLLALLLGLTTASAHDPILGVDPAIVMDTVAPGGSIQVEKTVHTPEIPPKPDIYFLADTTGSMEPVIVAVQTDAAAVLAAVAAVATDERFGAGDYKDFPFDAYAFLNAAPIPAADDGGAAASAAIALWAAGGGGDGPEGQFYALHQLAAHGVANFRADSTPIVVWFGDFPAHDPVCALISGEAHDTTEVSLTAELVAAGIRVVAISTTTGAPNGLDDDPTVLGGDYLADCGLEDGVAGQATRIVAATSGVHLIDVGPDEISAAILAGLGNLPVKVSPLVGPCDPSLSVTFDVPDQTVTSGDDASFTETINVAADAPQGGTVHCTVTWLLDDQVVLDALGDPDLRFVEEITINVPDVTPPAAACPEGVNPSGKNVPQAPGKGQNEDGFYELTATDNVDPDPQIFVADTGSGFVAGPFPSGTKIKLVQAPGAVPNVKPGPNEIDWMITLNGDALVTAVDDAGNVSAAASCLVPPPPK